MDPLERNVGLFLVAVVATATFVLWVRDQVRAGSDVTSRRRATRRALNFVVWGSLPWFVMAVGKQFASFDKPTDFLNPANGFFAYAFLASLFAMWGALLVWLFVGGGAEELAASEQVRIATIPVKTPTGIKVLFLLCIGGALIALAWLLINTTT